jgi:flagellar biogenesis protein FliO
MPCIKEMIMMMMMMIIIIIIIRMWHMVRLLQMPEKEKLPKLKTNSKLIKLQEEIN